MTGLVEGDSLITEPEIKTDEDTSQAGRYAVIPRGADAGSNYEIEYVNGTLIVIDKDTEKDIRITHTELTKVPEGLKDTQFNTVEAIKNEMASRIMAAYIGYSEDLMFHYDVVMQFSLDD